MCIDNTTRERVATLTSDRILGLIESTYKWGGLSFLFGDTGRGKTFTAEWWLRTNPDKGIYLRCTSGTTRNRLQKQLLAQLTGRKAYGTLAQTEQWMNDALALNKGKILIVDEANYTLGSSTRKAEEALNFFRDLYDTANIAVLLIFTSYDMDNLRRDKVGAFLEQFRGRQLLNLQIPRKLLKTNEVSKVVAAYVKEPDDALIDAAYRVASGGDGKIRALFKYLDLLAQLSKQEGKDRINAKNLEAIARRYENGGDWPEE